MFRYAASGEEVKWYKESRRLTFSAACRAAVGDILTDSDLDEMFPLADVLGQAAFAPVRTPFLKRVYKEKRGK
jgi:hypothetical protein